MSIYGDLINESLSTMIQDKFDNKIKEQKAYYSQAIKDLDANCNMKEHKKLQRRINKDISTFRNMSQTKGISTDLQNKLKKHLKFLEKQKKELDFLAFENGVSK